MKLLAPLDTYAITQEKVYIYGICIFIFLLIEIQYYNKTTPLLALAKKKKNNNNNIYIYRQPINTKYKINITNIKIL